jgi:capsular polysaccharide biosynthesis protein
MQLRDYWEIVRRRWPLVLLVPALTLVASGYFALRGPGAYCSFMKLAVTVRPDPTYLSDHYDPRLTSTQFAEYLADDLTEIFKSQAFGADVAAELGHSIEPGMVAAATRAKKTHRTIDLEVCGQDLGAVSELGQAYARVFETRLPAYFQQLQLAEASAVLINRPTVGRATSLAGIAAQLALRTLLGLALGLGLAFLLHYLDDRLRDRRDLERALELPILAEIPPHRETLVR